PRLHQGEAVPPVHAAAEQVSRRVAIEIAAALGAMWVAQRRDFYRRASSPLDDGPRSRLAAFFPSDLLRRTEVARVARIAGPLPDALSKWRPHGALDLSTVRGMAFIDTV